MNRKGDPLELSAEAVETKVVPVSAGHTRKGLLAFLLCMIYVLPAAAQSAVPNWLEDSLHGSAKMNTVIAVVAIILLGLGAWLFAQDRKLSDLEKRLGPNDRRIP